jgi:hypothetical protein
LIRLRRLQTGLTALATGPLAIGFAVAGLWWWWLGLILMGLLWGYADYRCWNWGSYLGFSGMMLAAGSGFLVGLPPLLLLPAASASLSAWDLGQFRQRLEAASFGPDTPALVRRHLLILLVVDLAGLGAAELALVVRLTVNLWLVILVVLILVFAFSRAARNLIQASE